MSRSDGRTEYRSDAGRAAVYAAELAAFDGTSYESIAPMDELGELVTRVTEAAWWPAGAVPVVPARSDAESSSTRQRGDARPVIRLAAGQRTPLTVLHELAHVLAGLDAGHGPSFRRAYLDLIASQWGERAATWLRVEFESSRLAIGERSWAAPPVMPGRLAAAPIAL